jgi:4'-phosphopantetheinyl transferase EntD
MKSEISAGRLARFHVLDMLNQADSPALDWWRGHAIACTIAMGAQPARIQMYRLTEDDRLLDGLTLAVALGIARSTSLQALQSPRLRQPHLRSQLRVHAALCAALPRPAPKRHWAHQAIKDLQSTVTATIGERTLPLWPPTVAHP